MIYIQSSRISIHLYIYHQLRGQQTAERNVAIEVVNFRIPPPFVGIAKRIVRVRKLKKYTRARAYVHQINIAGSRKRKRSLREVVIWSNRFQFLYRFLLSPSVILQWLSQLSLVSLSHVTFRSKRIYRYSFPFLYFSISVSFNFFQFFPICTIIRSMESIML